MGISEIPTIKHFTGPVMANNIWFEEDIKCNQPEDRQAKFRLSLCIDVDAIVSVVINDTPMSILQGQKLTSNALYTVDITLNGGEWFNLLCDTDCNVKRCSIGEVSTEG